MTKEKLAELEGNVRSEFRLLDQLRRDGKVERVHRLAVRVEDKIRKEAA